MKGRQPILMAVCGKKGVGKSFRTMEQIREYVKGDPANGVPGRKVLIFDVNNEYSDKSQFPDIRAISLNDIDRFSLRPIAEIRRVAPFWPDGTPMSLDEMAEVLMWLVQHFKNGLFLIEDINKYVTDAMPGDLIGAICTNRHTGVDIILHYQSIGRLTPKVWQNITHMRMHQNEDSIERHANKIPGKLEILSIAEKVVSNKYMNGDKRFYSFVDFDAAKIHADIKKEEAEDAISDYISENYSRMIRKMLNKRDRDGKQMYTSENVFISTRDQMLNTYFDLN